MPTTTIEKGGWSWKEVGVGRRLELEGGWSWKEFGVGKDWFCEDWSGVRKLDGINRVVFTRQVALIVTFEKNSGMCPACN